MQLKKQTINNYTLTDLTRLMQKYIADGQVNQSVRLLASAITAGIDGRQYDALAQAIYGWIRKNIRYIHDPVQAEWVQSADVTARIKTGDCDDFSVLAASLLESLGIRTKLRFVSTQPSGQVNHVFIDYYSPKLKKWIPFDAIVPKKVGWQSPSITGGFDMISVNRPGSIGFEPISTGIAVVGILGQFQQGGKALNWLAGKNSLIGKAFGGSERGHLTSKFFYKYFSDTFSDFLDYDGDTAGLISKYLSGWHKGKDKKYYVNLHYQGKEYPMRTDRNPNSHGELLEKAAGIILPNPERIPPYAYEMYQITETPKSAGQSSSLSVPTKTTTSTINTPLGPITVSVPGPDTEKIKRDLEAQAQKARQELADKIAPQKSLTTFSAEPQTAGFSVASGLLLTGLVVGGLMYAARSRGRASR